MSFVEQLAAKYPDVVDHYLRGGAARIRDAQAEVLAMVGLGNVDGATSLLLVMERVKRALGVLDRDPHYRFEYRGGEGPVPGAPSDRPMLVMHPARSGEQDGKRFTVDVIARCAASVDVEPITISGRFDAEPGSDSRTRLVSSMSTAPRWKPTVRFTARLLLLPVWGAC